MASSTVSYFMLLTGVPMMIVEKKRQDRSAKKMPALLLDL
jgi:hypothetical protein